MDMEKAELAYKLNFLEQKIHQFQQQMRNIEEGISETELLKKGFDELKGSEGKEIFSPIGKGIFIKSKILSEELIVDIGGKNFVKKTISETKKILDEEIKRLKDIKDELESYLKKAYEEVQEIIREVQREEN